MVPILISRLIVETAKSLSKLPAMLWDVIIVAGNELKAAFLELFYGFFSIMHTSMSNIVRLILAAVSAGYTAVIALMKSKNGEVFEQVNIVASGISDIVTASAADIQRAVERSGSNFNTAPIIGGLKSITAAMRMTDKIIKASSNSLMDNIVGITTDLGDMLAGIAIAFSKHSKQAAEWAYGLIVATTLAKVAMQAINGDFLGAGATLISGMAQASAVVEAYNQEAANKMEAEYDKNAERSEKYMARNDELAKKAAALEKELKEDKKVGSAEFKVKDVEDKATLSLEDYSLNAIGMIKGQWQEGAEDYMKGMKDDMMFKPAPSMTEVISKLGGTASTLLIAAVTLATALWPLSVTAAIIAGIILAVAGLVYLIIEYWDDIKKFFEWIGDAFAEWATALGDWLADLGKAMIQAGIDLFNYITSGQMFVDIWAMITSVVTELGRIFTVIGDGVKAAFQWVYDTLLAPVIKAFEDAFQWIYDTLLKPFVDALTPVFQWISDNILTPFCDGVSEAFQWVYDNILGPVIQAFQDAFQWIYDTLLKPFVDGIPTAFFAVFDTIDEEVLQPMRTFFDDLWKDITNIGKKVADIFKKPLEAFVNGVKAPFVWIYDNIIKPIINFNPVKAAGKGIASAASSVWGALTGKAHGGVIQAFAHGGAIGQTQTYWRAANGIRVPGLAGGGNNYGRDTVPAMLSPGEVVLPNSVAQNGNLMRDIGRLFMGESVPTGAVTNISANESTTNNSFTINVNVSGNARMDRKEVEREILPVILEGIKEASQRGRPVLSQKGVFQ
jgi:hypothetical protein